MIDGNRNGERAAMNMGPGDVIRVLDNTRRVVHLEVVRIDPATSGTMAIVVRPVTLLEYAEQFQSLDGT